MGITRQQALDCFASDDLIGIGMEADALRRTLHPEGVVSYTIDRPLDCSTPDVDIAYASARQSVNMGATGLFIGTPTPQPVTLAHYEYLFAGIKQRFFDQKPGLDPNGARQPPGPRVIGPDDARPA